MFVGGHSSHHMRRELHSRALPTVETLFPLTTGVSHWTTLPGAPNALPFDSTTLNPVKTIGALGINYVDTVPGGGDRRAIYVHFPAGSYTLNSDPRGGISFYSHGPDAKDVTGTALLTNAKEATFGYSVYFPPTFDFVMGGKLPGFFGGNTQDGSYSCSGGRKDTTCFSARLMWRENGDGEIYSYFPAFDEPGFATNKDLCDLPNNVCDPTYGISLGRGNFTFPKGAWTTVAQRVKLNDPGQANGEVELFVDGKSVIKSDKILMVDHTAESRIRGLQVQSFFGGSTIEWAPKTDQDLYFADFSVAVTEEYKTPPTAAAPPSGAPPSGNSNTGGANNGTNPNGNASQGGKPGAAVGLKVNKAGLVVGLMGLMALLVGA